MGELTHRPRRRSIPPIVQARERHLASSVNLSFRDVMKRVPWEKRSGRFTEKRRLCDEKKNDKRLSRCEVSSSGRNELKLELGLLLGDEAFATTKRATIGCRLAGRGPLVFESGNPSLWIGIYLDN